MPSILPRNARMKAGIVNGIFEQHDRDAYGDVLLAVAEMTRAADDEHRQDDDEHHLQRRQGEQERAQRKMARGLFGSGSGNCRMVASDTSVEFRLIQLVAIRRGATRLVRWPGRLRRTCDRRATSRRCL